MKSRLLFAIELISRDVTFWIVGNSGKCSGRKELERQVFNEQNKGGEGCDNVIMDVFVGVFVARNEFTNHPQG